MPTAVTARLRPVHMGSMSVDSECRADGTLVLRARGDLPGLSARDHRPASATGPRPRPTASSSPTADPTAPGAP